MNICIFGAGNEEISESYKQAVYHLGYRLAAEGHHLVYGGGAKGLMGAAARGFKAAGGKVTGIVPEIFDYPDHLFADMDEKIVTRDMAERKTRMIQVSQAYIAVAGGIGTYDELTEVMVEKQCGYYDKPIFVFNTCGFYDPFLKLLEHTEAEGFMRGDFRELVTITDDPEAIIRILKED